MRILAVSNLAPTPLNPSGGVFIQKRLEGLAAAGVEFRLVAPDLQGRVVEAAKRHRAGVGRGQGAAGSLPRQPTWHHVPVKIRPWEMPAGVYGDPRRSTARIARTILASIGDGGGYDLVMARGMYAFWAGGIAQELARILGIPFVVAVHGSDLMMLKPWRRQAFRQIASNALGLLFVSRALAEEAHARQVVPAAWDVTPSGFDGSIFHARGRISTDIPRVVYVGNLIPVKGADRLPALVRALRQREPRAQLEVVGDGPLRPRLERELAAERVRFLGRVPAEAVADRMRSADVLVLPSRSEGFGTVLVEARACGTRVVATGVGGAPEAVGAGGEIVDPNAFDPNAMADAVLRQWRAADPATVASGAQAHEWRTLGRREAEVLRGWMSGGGGSGRCRRVGEAVAL